MRRAFAQHLAALASSDPRIQLLTADLGYLALDPFRDAHPDRFLNGGVAEPNLVGVAAGLALVGRIPFVYSVSSFLAIRCLEQLKLDVALPGLPVKLVGVGAGVGYGFAGATHHSTDDVSALLSLPGLTVYCPADLREVTECLDDMTRRPGPGYLRLANEPVPEGLERPRFPSGGSPLLLNGRHEKALFTLGRRANAWMARLPELTRAGVSLVHVPVLPLDLERLDAILSGCRVAFVLDDQAIGTGFSAWLAYRVASKGFGVAVRSLGFDPRTADRFGAAEYLEATRGHSDEAVRQALELA